MPESVKEPQARTEPDIESVRGDAMAEGAKRALEDEKKRRGDIRALFANHPDHDKVRDACLDNPEVDVNEARKQLLDAIGKREEPVASGQRIEMGQTEVEKFARAAEDAVAFRAGIAGKDSEPSEFRGYTLLELARKSLEVRGVRVHGLDKRELVARAFTHSSSDFPKILENNARKAMLRGYGEAEEVFSMFTRVGNLSDFKTHSRVGLGVFETLDKIPEGGEYKHGTIGSPE